MPDEEQTLTLWFGRRLSRAEWDEVIQAVAGYVPYVVGLGKTGMVENAREQRISHMIRERKRP